MPIKSKAQWKYLAVKHPNLLHRFQKESPVRYKSLPEHNPKSKSRALKPTRR